MSHRSSALGVAVTVAVATACGGDGPSRSTAPTTVETSTTTSTTVLAQATTTRSPGTTSTTRRSGAATTSVPVPAGRTVTRGEAFSVGVGETVTVRGEGLTVTYAAVGADNRCRPGLQCIVAGNAAVSVTVRGAATPAASLVLNTDEPPRSARYGSYNVELVQLGFGSPPVARLRVT